MNYELESMAANAICHAASMVQVSWQEAAAEYTRPSVVFKPRLSKDGDMWCALFGENLQEGVSGFGKTPYYAMYDFDMNWNKP
jgi:hypothetical protein